MNPFKDICNSVKVVCTANQPRRLISWVGPLLSALNIILFHSTSQAYAMNVQAKIELLKQQALVINELKTEDNYSHEVIKSIDRILKYCIEKDKTAAETLLATAPVRECVLQQANSSPLAPATALELVDIRLQRASLHKGLVKTLEEVIATHKRFESRLKQRMNMDLREFTDVVVSSTNLSDRQGHELFRQMTNNLRYFVSLQRKLFDHILKFSKLETDKQYYTNYDEKPRWQSPAQKILDGIPFYAVNGYNDASEMKRLAPIFGYLQPLAGPIKTPAFLIYDYSVAELMMRFSNVSLNELIRYSDNCNYIGNDSYRAYEVLGFADFLYVAKVFHVNSNELKVDCKEAFFYKNVSKIDYDSATNTATTYYYRDLNSILHKIDIKAPAKQHWILLNISIPGVYYTADPFYQILDANRESTISDYLMRTRATK